MLVKRTQMRYPQLALVMDSSSSSSLSDKTHLVKLTRESLAQLIDHTLVRADVTESEIDRLCKEAATYRFKSVCVNPYWVKRCAKHLDTMNIAVCSTVGFPLGSTLSLSKISEAEQAIADGATELDMVMNIGEFKAGNHREVVTDMIEIVSIAHKSAKVKVIIETCLLNDEEKKKACELIMDSGAQFVKTSTGFNVAGAQVPDIQLIREVVGPRLGIKASSGIHTLVQAQALLDAGATRLGCTKSVPILFELQDQSDRIS
jgi:deoxyribose-phosphate aldolase